MPKRPEDAMQLAKAIREIATGQTERQYLHPLRMVYGGSCRPWKIGGPKGGKARAKALSERRRKQVARTATSARWPKNRLI